MIWVVEETGICLSGAAGSQAARYFVFLNLATHPGPWTELFKYVNSQTPPQSYGPIPKGGVEMSRWKSLRKRHYRLEDGCIIS